MPYKADTVLLYTLATKPFVAFDEAIQTVNIKWQLYVAVLSEHPYSMKQDAFFSQDIVPGMYLLDEG